MEIETLTVLFEAARFFTVAAEVFVDEAYSLGEGGVSLVRFGLALIRVDFF